MFETLSERLGRVLSDLTGRGKLSETDIRRALKDVRRALIEADVALPVVTSFIEGVSTDALGQTLVKSVTPGQMIVKIVHDHLVRLLGGEESALSLSATPPVPLMLVGLQGSGKTTTCAKLAYRLQSVDKKRVLMASLDTSRPAAQQQLESLGSANDIMTLPIIAGEKPLQIARRAKVAAELGGYDVYLLDTAGRLHIDEPLMQELVTIQTEIVPKEILFVADALLGQDALHQAETFNARLDITGVILTRLDGDARGGAALSIRLGTGKPIKFVGMGEKVEALDVFYPERIAGRILGMGDIVSLVEKASAQIDSERAQEMERRLQKGIFNFNDLAEQITQITKMGGMGKLMGMMPGFSAMKTASLPDETLFLRYKAVIDSMTPLERRKPDILKASRKKRISAGSGVSIQEINRLFKMRKQMALVAKKMGKEKKKGGFLRSLFGGKEVPEKELLEDKQAMAQSLKEAQLQGIPGPGIFGPQAPSFPGGLTHMPPSGGGRGRAAKRRKTKSRKG